MNNKIPGSLELYIPGLDEFFDEATSTFVTTEGKIVYMQHSLLSISLWESKYKKPFLTNDKKTPEEFLDYIFMMNIDSELEVEDLSPAIVEEITLYMNDVPSATIIKDSKKSSNNVIMTSEVIYAYMANASIDFSCETWNIGRLFKLLGVIGEFNNKQTEMSQSEIIERQKNTNEINKAKLAALKKQKYQSEGDHDG